jgi:hypothetical protein
MDIFFHCGKVKVFAGIDTNMVFLRLRKIGTFGIPNRIPRNKGTELLKTHKIWIAAVKPR